MRTNRMFKRGRVAIAAVAAAGAAIAVSAAPASAAVPHTFKVCAYGNYTAYGVLPQQGGFSTFLALPGSVNRSP